MAWTKAQLQKLVVDAANSIGFPVQIALNQINQESRWNINAGSNAGAVGLAQFMPATAKRFGLVDRRNPVESMKAWAKYMSWLMKRFKGNIAFALAGYNAGEGAVDKYKGIPPYKETQDYVRIILQGATKIVTDGTQNNVFKNVSVASSILPTANVGNIFIAIGLSGLGIAIASRLSK